MSGIKKAAAFGLTLTMAVGMLPAAAFAYSSKDGWVEKDGKWYYYEEGRKIKGEVRFDPSTSKRYLLNESGIRVTKKGWTTLKYYYSDYGNKIKQSRKYYLGEGGEASVNGWKKIKGKYYYFADSFMASDTIVPKYDEDLNLVATYAVDKKGVRVTKKGWHHFKGTRYSKLAGSKITYDAWVYVKKGGKLVTGLKKIGKKKYVFDYSGVLAQNTAVASEGGKKCYLADKNGVQVTKKGWHKVKHTTKEKDAVHTYTFKTTYSYYVKSDGTLQIGLKKIKGKYYYFNPVMMTNTTYTKEGKEYDTRYYFGKNGECKKTDKIYHDTVT